MSTPVAQVKGHSVPLSCRSMPDARVRRREEVFSGHRSTPSHCPAGPCPMFRNEGSLFRRQVHVGHTGIEGVSPAGPCQTLMYEVRKSHAGRTGKEEVSPTVLQAHARRSGTEGGSLFRSQVHCGCTGKGAISPTVPARHTGTEGISPVGPRQTLGYRIRKSLQAAGPHRPHE